MLLECNEVKKHEIMYSTKQALYSSETKGFLIGFVATIASGILSLIIFNQYFANKAAAAAVAEFEKKYYGQEDYYNPYIP